MHDIQNTYILLFYIFDNQEIFYIISVNMISHWSIWRLMKIFIFRQWCEVWILLCVMLYYLVLQMIIMRSKYFVRSLFSRVRIQFFILYLAINILSSLTMEQSRQTQQRAATGPSPQLTTKGTEHDLQMYYVWQEQEQPELPGIRRTTSRNVDIKASIVFTGV